MRELILFTKLQEHFKSYNRLITLSFFEKHILSFLNFEDIKEKYKYTYHTYINIYLFYSNLRDFLNNVNKFLALKDLKDCKIEDLTKEQLLIVEEFTMFLIKFWADGLKLISFFNTIEDFNLDIYNCKYYWVILIEFWFKIPIFLYYLRPFFFIPTDLIPKTFTEEDFFTFLFSNKSLNYCIAHYKIYEFDESREYPLAFYCRSFRKLITWYWYNKFDSFSRGNIPNDLMYYLFMLLKENNKNFKFEIENFKEKLEKAELEEEDYFKK